MLYLLSFSGRYWVRLPSVRPILAFVISLFFLICSSHLFASEPRQFEGVIYPIEERELALPVNGLIDELMVAEGDSVEKGQILVRLRSQVALLETRRRRIVWEDDTAVSTSAERLEIIGNQYQILYDLFDTTGSVSRDELNALLLEKIQTKGQLDKSRIQKTLSGLEYQLADQQLKQRSLSAPIDGLVTKIEKFNGEWVSAGETVATMVDLSSVVLRPSISDALARQLEPDSEVVVNIDGVGESAGVVRFVSPVADPASGLVRIKITIPNPDGLIRPGTRGRVFL